MGAENTFEVEETLLGLIALLSQLSKTTRRKFRFRALLNFKCSILEVFNLTSEACASTFQGASFSQLSSGLTIMEEYLTSISFINIHLQGKKTFYSAFQAHPQSNLNE
ncbi:CLUMA_CG016850, isoform A [Clunio marinus]|uniref:CLUMA_CG016850, isoform A n=1 Tax=Clunio marinus TaxID=568069 RepID=A0A1J1ITR0_9DIPT|nr:CLUMA_CG016850, isoform A [Clunio marinus]